MVGMKVCFIALVLGCFSFFQVNAQPTERHTRKDTLMGSNTTGRSWWDVQRYDVTVAPDYATKTLKGRTTITYTVVADVHDDYLQFDLQQPMQVDSLYFNGNIYINYPPRPFYNEGSHWFVPLPKTPKGTTQSLTVVYHGQPKEGLNAPWDGGWVWAKDDKGRPWMSAACQGEGASLWYPCKDTWSDEPDKGASLTVVVPAGLVAIGNGRLKSRSVADGQATFSWEVTAPINPYNLVPYIGHYATWSDTLQGEKGSLDLSYWVLDYDLPKAQKQFGQVKPTLRSFEHWFGPYPFYEDGYKLVQSPYLGMEHQSAVAYGNGFSNGYLGTDLSGTGWGLKWDYIIVHESGHEWFGNNVTGKDRADMWVHEGFTDYSETLFIQTYYGKAAGDEYTQGLRKNILNDKPVLGAYGVNREGSGDMYFKGANLLHTLRQVIDNDHLFREILRGLNRDFYRQTVSSGQVEEYISQKSGKDFRKVFDQYLRTTMIPVLEYRRAGNGVQCRWRNVVPGFAMPVRLTNGRWITPGEKWQPAGGVAVGKFGVDKNFYIHLRKL